MNPRRNIYLIGPMGSGKTAVGRQLAKALRMEFRDSDLEIQQRTGVDIPYIFEKEGEGGFRVREHDIIADLTTLQGLVVATGGGVVLDADNRSRMTSTGIVIYLDTSIEEQLRRTKRTRHRPLLLVDDPRRVLLNLRAVREPLYQEIAHITVDTTGRRVPSVVAALERELKAYRVPPLQICS